MGQRGTAEKPGFQPKTAKNRKFFSFSSCSKHKILCFAKLPATIAQNFHLAMPESEVYIVSIEVGGIPQKCHQNGGKWSGLVENKSEKAAVLKNPMKNAAEIR